MRKKVKVGINSKDCKKLLHILTSVMRKQSITLNPVRLNNNGKSVIEISY